MLSDDIVAQVEQLKQQDGGDLLLQCGHGNHLHRDIAEPITLVPERTVAFADGMELRHYRPLYTS